MVSSADSSTSTMASLSSAPRSPGQRAGYGSGGGGVFGAPLDSSLSTSCTLRTSPDRLKFCQEPSDPLSETLSGATMTGALFGAPLSGKRPSDAKLSGALSVAL